MNAFCDVLVVGSGPAGLMAASAAAESGERIILAELDAALGGTANWSDETIDGTPAAEWASTMVRDLKSRQNVRLLPRTTVWGYYDSNTLSALQRVTDHKSSPARGEPRHRHWIIRARSVVLATGALERPLVFPGNDRPGIMLASAAQRYVNQFGVVPGRKVAIFTNNDSAYRAALAMNKAGGKIVAIIDLHGGISPAAAGIADAISGQHLHGHAVIATEGGKQVSGIKIQPFDAATGRLSGDARNIQADSIGVGRLVADHPSGKPGRIEA